MKIILTLSSIRSRIWKTTISALKWSFHIAQDMIEFKICSYIFWLMNSSCLRIIPWIPYDIFKTTSSSSIGSLHLNIYIFWFGKNVTLIWLKFKKKLLKKFVMFSTVKEFGTFHWWILMVWQILIMVCYGLSWGGI